MNTFYRYWSFTLVIKLIIGATLPFSSDEAYYWVWSQNLQLSYFDHPAMIAWLLKLGHVFDAFGLRWPVIVLGHCSWILIYELFKSELVGTRLWIWVAVMFLNPLFGWGTFLAIPDTPAAFFLCASLYASVRWYEAKHIKWALALGVSLGLGFNSKYHMVLFVPAFLIWITWLRGWRYVRWAHVPIIIFTGILCSLPVLIWNYQNNFDSFLFQLHHGLSSEARRISWPFEYLGSQVALLFPTVFWLALRRPTDSRRKLLYVMGWFPILFFLWSSFSARPEGNWPILGYAPLLTLAVLQAKNFQALRYTVWIWCAGMLIAFSEAKFSWLPIQNKENLKTAESTRFDVFVPWVAGTYDPALLPGPKLPVYASSFQMAATLNFKTRLPIYKLKTLSRRDAYDYLGGSEPPASGRFIVLANRETNFNGTILDSQILIEEKHFTADKKIMIYEVHPK